jgi:5-formyltetrahydrofolate cyclo-ligase
MQAKAAARDAVLHARGRLTVGEREAAGRAIAAALASVLERAGTVAAYVAVGSEPPTAPALELCTDVLLPVLLDDGDLDWARGELAPTRRGLLEPTGPRHGVDAIAACDVVLVPALAADRAGNRLGRGGGSYDRALRRATGLTIAVLYDEDLLDLVPVEPHDVAVEAVVTPSYGLLRV